MGVRIPGPTVRRRQNWSWRAVYVLVRLVQGTGIEPVTSGFSDQRSYQTELPLQNESNRQ